MGAAAGRSPPLSCRRAMVGCAWGSWDTGPLIYQAAGELSIVAGSVRRCHRGLLGFALHASLKRIGFRDDTFGGWTRR
jgi:hypothetical protein